MLPECSLLPEPSVSRHGLVSSRAARKFWGGPVTELRFSGNFQIEDLRKHSEETIARLQRLLADGATLEVDPRSKDFYEVENGRVVYYIHVPPTPGKVYLLATWPKEDASAAAKGSSQSRHTTAG